MNDGVEVLTTPYKLDKLAAQLISHLSAPKPETVKEAVEKSPSYLALERLATKMKEIVSVDTPYWGNGATVYELLRDLVLGKPEEWARLLYAYWDSSQFQELKKLSPFSDYKMIFRETTDGELLSADETGDGDVSIWYLYEDNPAGAGYFREGTGVVLVFLEA